MLLEVEIRMKKGLLKFCIVILLGFISTIIVGTCDTPKYSLLFLLPSSFVVCSFVFINELDLFGKSIAAILLIALLFIKNIIAILFHKPFICYKRFSEKEKFSQNSRIENLLQLTGFSDRLGLESKSVSELLDVSFSISDEWINSMKAQSIHYLQKAFNEEVE